MSYWVLPGTAAEVFSVSMDEVCNRMLIGAWPIKEEHALLLVDVAASLESIAAEAPVVPDGESLVQSLPAVLESAMPHRPDGDIAVDEIEFDYHTARIETAKRRRPPQAN
jgi:hypothetical protein